MCPCAVLQSHLLGVFTAEGISKDSLPDEVDWRGTGADNVVKDQATCGSCWVRQRACLALDSFQDLFFCVMASVRCCCGFGCFGYASRVSS